MAKLEIKLFNSPICPLQKDTNSLESTAVLNTKYNAIFSHEDYYRIRQIDNIRDILYIMYMMKVNSISYLEKLPYHGLLHTELFLTSKNNGIV